MVKSNHIRLMIEIVFVVGTYSPLWIILTKRRQQIYDLEKKLKNAGLSKEKNDV
jgi:hypothetical protein